MQYASWRWIFLINLPLAALTVVIAQRWVPETRDPDAPRHFDVGGAALAAVALGGITYAPHRVGAARTPRWPASSACVTAVAFLGGGATRPATR